MKTNKLKALILRSAFLIGIGIVSSFGMGAQPVHAEWKANSTGWWYTSGNSWYTGWHQVGNTWYYFDANGYMKSNAWVDNYYVDSTGAWTKTSEAGKWEQQSDGWHSLINGTSPATGWHEVKGTWYYFNETGRMQTGTVIDNGKEYNLDSTGAWNGVAGKSTASTTAQGNAINSIGVEQNSNTTETSNEVIKQSESTVSSSGEHSGGRHKSNSTEPIKSNVIPVNINTPTEQIKPNIAPTTTTPAGITVSTKNEEPTITSKSEEPTVTPKKEEPVMTPKTEEPVITPSTSKTEEPVVTSTTPKTEEPVIPTTPKIEEPTNPSTGGSTGGVVNEGEHGTTVGDGNEEIYINKGEKPADGTGEVLSDSAFYGEVCDKLNYLVNVHRGENNKTTLSISSDLKSSAKAKSQDMITNDYFAHERDGKDFQTLVKELSGTTVWGENIAMNYFQNTKTKADADHIAETLFDQWKTSPGHNANMLKDEWTKMGFGYATKAEDGGYTSVYATQHFSY